MWVLRDGVGFNANDLAALDLVLDAKKLYSSFTRVVGLVKRRPSLSLLKVLTTRDVTTDHTVK